MRRRRHSVVLLHLIGGATHVISFELVVLLVSRPHWALTVLIVVLLLISNIAHAIIFLFLLLMMHVLHKLLMLLLLMMINWRKLAHARSLGTQHLVLLLQFLDLTLQLSYLDILQFQLSLNLTHWLLLTAHIMMALVGSLGRIVVSSGTTVASEELNEAQLFV